MQVPASPRIMAAALLVLILVLSGCTSTPAGPVETGSVRIISSPPGAAVYIDGEYRGTTPATVTALPAGGHTLEIRANGYSRWTAPVTIGAGGMINVTATLAALPVTAMPVTFATAVVPTQAPGFPEIHIDGYWTYPPGISSSTQNPVPLIVHTEGFNVGDADAREVTVSANLYYGGRQVCWKTVYLGTLKSGGHVASDTMVTCPLPSGLNSGDMTVRFENVVVTP